MATATATPKKISLTREEFCRIWSTSNSVEEVAAANGTEVQAVNARAKKYREEYGIELKEFPPRGRGRRVSDEEIKKLRDMVAKLNKAK